MSVTLYQPYSFFGGAKVWSMGSVESPREHVALEFHSGAQTLVLYGSFLANQLVGIAGRVESISLFDGGARLYDIDGVDKDVGLFIDALGKGSFETVMLPSVLSGNDYIFGSDGDDGLAGFDGNDIIHAGPGNDRIDAGAGDDLIVIGAGNNVVDGGAGFDRVGRIGKLADFKITRTEGGFTMTDLQSGAIDTLLNVERIQLSDKQIALDVAVDNHGGQAYRLYRAAFDRAPDEYGLRFWTKQLDNGMSMVKLAESFIASDEYKALYGTVTGNHELVLKFYEHVLHRAPDPVGLDFWTGVLDQHRATTAEVLATISESPENIAVTTPLIVNGVVLDYPVIY